MKSFKGGMSVRMSDIAEEDSVEEEWKKKKKEQQDGGVKMIDDLKVQKQSLKVGSESLHSQMSKKVGATDCIIVVGTTGLGKSTCVNLYTGQNLPTGDSAQSV